MTLYNLRTDGDNYRITKFTNDLDVESSYLTSHNECACPAGHRPTCRHRQMLPTMLAANLCDSGGFYDFESGQVLLPVTDEFAPEGVTVLNIDSPEQMHNALADALGEPRSYNRPSYAEGEVGITAEELAAEIPTYEQVIAEGHAEMTASDAKPTEDKPHPHLPKVDRRV